MFDKGGSPFLKLLNTVEGLLNYLEIPFDFTSETGKFKNEIIPIDWSGTHPHEYLNIRIMGKFHGAVNSVHPLLLRAFKVKGNFSVAVIDIADFETRPTKSKTKYAPISKFPTSRFDCTVVMDKDAHAADVLTVLKKVKVKELTDRKIVDVFNMDNGKKAVTITVTFEDPNKTLDNEIIKGAEQLVIKTLEEAGYPLKA